MNLVFLAPFAYSPKATVSARMFPMAAALAGRGHRVTVLIPPRDNPADNGRMWRDSGVAFENVCLAGGPAVADYAMLAIRLARRVIALRPDAVHVFKPVGIAALAMLALARAWPAGRGIPLVVDNDDWEGRGGWLDVQRLSPVAQGFVAWQEKWALCRASAVSVASDALRDRTRAFRGSSDRIALLPNGPREDLRALAESGHARRASTREELGWVNRSVAIYAGTVPAVHDLDVLVEAFSKVVSHAQPRPLLALAAVGQGLASLRDAVRAAGIGAAVQWFDFMPYPRFVDLLCAADAGVFPYRDTPINRAKCSGKVIDYIACGLPAVLSDVGMSATYIRQGTTGWLAPPGDAPAFGAALSEALTDPDRARRMAEEARVQLWRDFSWPARAAQLENLYTIASP